MGTEDHGIWKQVLDSKYGSWRNLNVITVPTNASRWWKEIHKVCENVESGIWFDNCLEWVVGEGQKVKFWKDKWIGEEPLCSRFPRLYMVSECKDTTIMEVGHWEANVWVWDLKWRRQRLVWEAGLEDQLLLLLNGKNPIKGKVDSWKWKEDGEDIFSVKSAYNKLQGVPIEGNNKVFETLWRTRVTPKAQLLGWRLFLDRLPTKAKLIHRGYHYNILYVSCV